MAERESEPFVMVTFDLSVQGCCNYVSSPLGKCLCVCACTCAVTGGIGRTSWCIVSLNPSVVTDWENNDNAGAMRSASRRTATLSLSPSLWLTQIAVTAKADSGPALPTPMDRAWPPGLHVSHTLLSPCSCPLGLSLWNCHWTPLRCPRVHHNHWWHSHMLLQLAVLAC